MNLVDTHDIFYFIVLTIALQMLPYDTLFVNFNNSLITLFYLLYKNVFQFKFNYELYFYIHL